MLFLSNFSGLQCTMHTQLMLIFVIQHTSKKWWRFPDLQHHLTVQNPATTLYIWDDYTLYTTRCTSGACGHNLHMRPYYEYKQAVVRSMFWLRTDQEVNHASQSPGQATHSMLVVGTTPQHTTHSFVPGQHLSQVRPPFHILSAGTHHLCTVGTDSAGGHVCTCANRTSHKETEAFKVLQWDGSCRKSGLSPCSLNVFSPIGTINMSHWDIHMYPTVLVYRKDTETDCWTGVQVRGDGTGTCSLVTRQRRRHILTLRDRWTCFK